MKPNTTVNAKPRRARPEETVAERRVRLASYAIERGHEHTLRRHLRREGLDPESRFYLPGVGVGHDTLIGGAAWHGDAGSIKALEDAGARMTEDEIVRAIDTSNPRMAAYLLATKKIDPAGAMGCGRLWADCIAELEPESLRNLFMTMRDADHPKWRISMFDADDRARWVEILRQEIDEQDQMRLAV